MLTTREVAALFAVTPQRIRQLVKAGRLSATRQETARGVILLFEESQVEAFTLPARGWRKGRKRGITNESEG
jgi:excisionase family DNA binding protein